MGCHPDVLWLTWQEVSGIFNEFLSWLEGTWIGDKLHACIEQFKKAWGGIASFFLGLIKDWTDPFTHFFDDIERRLTALRNGDFGRAFGPIGAVPTNPPPMAPGPDQGEFAPTNPGATQNRLTIDLAPEARRLLTLQPSPGSAPPAGVDLLPPDRGMMRMD